MSGKKNETILFVEYFGTVGGGQVVLLNLLKRLRRKYDVQVLMLNEGPFFGMLEKEDIRVHYIKTPPKIRYRYFWDYLPFMFRFLRLLKDIKPSLVYVNGYFAAKLTAVPCSLLKLPFIWHKHITVDKKPGSYLGRQIRILSKITKRMICVSDSVKQTILDLGVEPEKLVTIHNGIGLPEPGVIKRRKNIRKEYGIGRAPLAGAVGVFRRNKGFDLLIRAAAISAIKLPGLKVMLVGGGDHAYEDELRQLAYDLKVQDRIILTGYGDKFDFMPAFDVFVLPSLKEPFGMVTLEAASLKIPAVAFATGGTVEIVKDGYSGFLAGKITAEALAEKMTYALKNRAKLKKAGINAFNTVKTRFTLDEQAKKIAAVIDEAIGN
jgi:glycosyltransferase involved in cell wall biosynthesis